MKVIFDDKPGDVHSIFMSLLYSCNKEYFKGFMKKMGIELDQIIERDYELIGEWIDTNNERLKFFFDKEVGVYNVLLKSEELWKSPTLEGYLKHVLSLGDIEFKKRMIDILAEKGSVKGDIPKQERKDELLKDDSEIVDLIKKLDIPGEVKWSLFCFAEEMREYIEGFVELIRRYLPFYNKLIERHRKEIQEFNKEMEENIHEKGVEYLREIVGNVVKFEKYSEIYVSTSFYSSYSQSIALEDDKCYIYVGTRVKESAKHMLGETELEKHLQVFKNFSDKTRFEIIKFLLTGERYGQEIAQEMGITTATVSYHMNFLFAANLVHIDKRDRKIFYVFDKDTVRKTIGFLERELEL